jgi:hypothetical protein
MEAVITCPAVSLTDCTTPCIPTARLGKPPPTWPPVLSSSTMPLSHPKFPLSTLPVAHGFARRLAIPPSGLQWPSHIDGCECRMKIIKFNVITKLSVPPSQSNSSCTPIFYSSFTGDSISTGQCSPPFLLSTCRFLIFCRWL